MKTEWQVEYLGYKPLEFEQVNNEPLWIQRKDIKENIDPEFGGYICQCRFVSPDVKEQLENYQEMLNETSDVTEYVDGYNASVILLGGQTTNLESRAVALRPVIEQASQYLDDDTALEAPEIFPAWESGVTYKQADRVARGLDLYKCLQAHTSQSDWLPELTPSLWLKMDNPEEEWPEWHQPTGGHDAYAKGYKVSHNGKHWVSDLDGNVWEPGVYGWSEV